MHKNPIIFLGVITFTFLIANEANLNLVKTKPRVVKNAPMDFDNFLLQQDFNGSWSTQSPPPGWTIYYTTPVGNSDWHREGANQSPWSDNSTPYACLYYHPQETGEDILTSPIVNCSLYTNVTLRCSTYFVPQEGSYTAKLQGSSDGGASWIELFNYDGQNFGPGLQVFPCSWADNKSNVKFRWYFSGNSNQIYHWSIDNVSVTADPIILDVGVRRIIAPTGTINYDTVITPQVTVKNFGNVTASFPVIFKIGPFYTDMQYANISPGESTYVNFAPWTATQIGTHVTKCTTALANDGNSANDTLSGSVTVQLKDVSVTQIIAPSGTIDSISSIIPQARVRNYGSSVETFNVTFKIGAFYIQTRTKTLDPSIEDTVNFSAWEPTRGTFTTRCSTYLAGDIDHTNDTLSGSVTVQVKDVGVIEIIAPTGIVDSGATIVPKASVQNFGTNPETFPVTFQIGSWLEIQNPTLLPGQIDTVSFPAWTAHTPGIQMVICYSSLAGDQRPENDILLDSVLVQVRDVGVSSIIAPAGVITPDTVIPRAWVKNYGTLASGPFNVRFDITPGYTDAQPVTNINAGDSLLLSFAPWADTEATYTTKCTTMLAGDCNKNNDFKTGTVVVSVDAPPSGGWVELSEIIPGIRPVKNGSCMEVVNDTLVYVVKSNKTFDFYRLNTNQDTFKKMADIPSGLSNKEVKKAAKMAGDGERYIYFVKGSNTLEFFRYDTEKDSWKTLPDVPIGGGKKIKDGTGMAYCENNGESFIYLLKGAKTSEFYRYNINADSWEKMQNAPPGKLKPGFKKGSDIVCDPENKIIYCLKGRTNEMFMYDVNGDTWFSKQLTNMPLIHPLYGKNKKVKGGGTLCWVDPEKIYALKGGNTPEFWLFKPLEGDSGTWVGLGLIPDRGADGKKRRVKDGADLVTVLYGDAKALLAMKGNKTDKLWKWADTLTFFVAKTTPLTSNVCGTMHKTIFDFKVTPNPVRKIATISYTLPKVIKATLKLYNVIGKVVDEFEMTERIEKFSLDTEKLPAGVYLLKFEADKFRATRKIIVSR